MSFSTEEVELLLKVARDAQVGVSFDERMAAALETLSVVIPSASLSVWVADPQRPSDVRAVFRNNDVAHLRDYLEHYAQIDPMIEHSATHVGDPCAISDLVPASRFGRDAYTGEFLQKHGLRHLLAVMDRLPGGRFLGVCLQRERGQRDFTRRERDALRLVTPDLTRASAGALLQEELAARVDRQGGEPPSVGCVVLSLAAGTMRMDPGACALAALTVSPLADHVISLARALTTPSWDATLAESLLSLRDDGVLRLRASSLAPNGAEVVVTLERLHPSSQEHFDAVADRIGLTARERDVARRAVHDMGYRHIAFELGLSIGTVNCYMARIYSKAGVSSKVGLANLFLGRATQGRAPGS